MLPLFIVAMSDTASRIPPALYEHLTNAQSTNRVIGAIKIFLEKGDAVTFEYAVALYLAAARAREEPIDVVLSVLTNLSESIEGTVLSPPSYLQTLIFRSILRAFYGEVAVAGERTR